MDLERTGRQRRVGSRAVSLSGTGTMGLGNPWNRSDDRGSASDEPRVPLTRSTTERVWVGVVEEDPGVVVSQKDPEDGVGDLGGTGAGRRVVSGSDSRRQRGVDTTDWTS